jgi:SAM-dependent methyltransferase
MVDRPDSGSGIRVTPKCPICAASAPRVIKAFTVGQVATHFIPASRDREHHAELRRLISEIWGGEEEVNVHACPSCTFVFADPWADGSERFYNLVSGGDPHYPRNRWEFHRTIASLRTSIETHDSAGVLRLLEVGAGSGEFLKQFRASAIGPRFAPVAIEYDGGARARLEKAGFDVLSCSLGDLAADEQRRARFRAICLFQTLEHIADVHGTFAAVSDLLSPNGDLFVSVPWSEAIEVQEDLSGYWDLPPNHVGRWTRSAFERIAKQHGLAVVEWELEQIRRPSVAWQLAVYAVRARAYDEDSMAGRVNRLRIRRLRGPAKRLMAVAFVPRMLSAWHRLCPPTQWVHIRHANQGEPGVGAAGT